jgi:uncharacterized protein YbjQ (UPF0145 family)
MGKAITLDSRQDYQSILKNIRQLGVLRVDSCYQKNGITFVTLHERTAKEWLAEKLNSAKATASRKAAEEALISLVEAKALRPEQLVQNIRDRTKHDADITGRALCRDYARVAGSQNPQPLKGGTIAARGKGNSVQILAAPAIKVRCDHAILRDTTAISDISGRIGLNKSYHSLGDWQLEARKPMRNGNGIDTQSCVSQSIEVGLAANSWTCIADVVLPRTGPGSISLLEGDVEAMIRAALDGAKGSVVIEPIPDQLIEKNGQEIRTYSDKGLRAQLRAAREATKSAKSNGNNLVVSFASENQEVLTRLKSISSKGT